MSKSFTANMNCARDINNASLHAEVNNRTEMVRCDVISSTLAIEEWSLITAMPWGPSR